MQITAILFSVLTAIATSVEAARGAGPTEADIPANVPPELKSLIVMTFSPDAATRGRAAESLESMGDAAAPAVPFLLRLLSDDADTHESDSGVSRVSVRAWFALKKVGKPAIGPCTKALKDARGVERLDLIDILGESGDPQALDVVVPLINGADEETSSRAIMSLWHCKDPRIVAPLAEAVKKNRSTNERGAAVKGLANVRDPRAVDALLAAMKDKDLDIRCDAVDSLGEQQDPAAVPALLDAMRQPGKEDVWVPPAAARALGKIRDPRALGPLLALLKDGSSTEYLRAAAATGLGLMGNREALPPLTLVLKETRESARLRTEAIHAIGKLDGAASLPLLTQIAKTAEDADKVRFWAAMEVLTITDGGIDSVAILRPLRGFFDRSESYEANEYHMKLRDAALGEVVSHGKNAAVRSAAAKMLAERTSKKSEDEGIFVAIVVGAFILVLLAPVFLRLIGFKSWKGKGKVNGDGGGVGDQRALITAPKDDRLLCRSVEPEFRGPSSGDTVLINRVKGGEHNTLNW